ncbi:hypothetical protein TUM19329_04090 [Legionella antarctica]|uniref:Uncharacterized protein n=1 Tax=Legionella antarctica TaxID=2708020 RepID=A0A6F8T0Y1_9GAMM|nr:hypothetical protein [Legionella antarctica]BCA94048.1 hypothetical protein TUM19329_04090 [Legionella antarctica]
MLSTTALVATVIGIAMSQEQYDLGTSSVEETLVTAGVASHSYRLWII